MDESHKEKVLYSLSPLGVNTKKLLMQWGPASLQNCAPDVKYLNRENESLSPFTIIAVS